MIGPMIGTSSSTPAMTDSRIAYRPKIGSTSWLSTSRPTNVNDADREAEDELAADPLAEDALDAVAGPAQRVEPPVAGRARSKEADEADPVLEEVGDPDRQDEVAEDGADQAAGAGEERQQEGQVDPGPTVAALPDPGDDAVDPVADRERDLERA